MLSIVNTAQLQISAAVVRVTETHSITPLAIPCSLFMNNEPLVKKSFLLITLSEVFNYFDALVYDYLDFGRVMELQLKLSVKRSPRRVSIGQRLL